MNENYHPLMKKLLLMELTERMKRLSGKQKQVVELYLLGLNISEIAKNMYISQSSARTYFIRACQKLRENRK